MGEKSNVDLLVSGEEDRGIPTGYSHQNGWSRNPCNVDESQKHDGKWKQSTQKTTCCLVPSIWNFRKGETVVTEKRSVISWGECRGVGINGGGCVREVFMALETSMTWEWSCLRNYVRLLNFHQTLHLKWVNFIAYNYTWLQGAE